MGQLETLAKLLCFKILILEGTSGCVKQIHGLCSLNFQNVGDVDVPFTVVHSSQKDHLDMVFLIFIFFYISEGDVSGFEAGIKRYIVFSSSE